jgi:capsular polysaccharide biosynthesis protein
MQARNFVRRQKWRLRPFKRVVLPLRNLKRAMVAFIRPPLAIARSTPNYSGLSLVATRQIHGPAPVKSAPPGSGSATVLSEPAWVFQIKEVDFWGRYGGSIVTADNFLLADLSPEVWGVDNHPIFSRLRLPKRRTLGGRTAIAVTPEAAGNYYHWLIDLLPRVSLLKPLDHSFDFDRLLINGSRAPYESESLHALGIPADKIQYVDASHRFHLAHAAVASMDHSAKVTAPWKIEALRKMRDTMTGRPPIPARRLYLSRKRAAVRRILNEGDLETLLRDNGFATVHLESCSWSEQVAMFASAEVVLAPHGAALANIAFCRPGTVVAEISTPAGYRDFFLQLAASADLKYCHVEARPKAPGAKSSFRATENEDMIVELQSLKEFLASV